MEVGGAASRGISRGHDRRDIIGNLGEKKSASITRRIEEKLGRWQMGGGVMDGVRQEGRVNPETGTVPRRFERELEEMGKAAGDALRTNPVGRH